MKDPLAALLAEQPQTAKRYSLSLKADLYDEIMDLAEEMSVERGSRVSATKVIGGCIALYKQKRAELEKKR